MLKDDTLDMANTARFDNHFGFKRAGFYSTANICLQFNLRLRIKCKNVIDFFHFLICDRITLECLKRNNVYFSCF